MISPRQLFRRYPLVSFFALACLFGWSNYLLAAFGVGSNPENNPLGPVVAALVVLGCQGRSSLGVWWRRIRTLRVHPGWYALALFTPALIHVAIVAVNHVLGAPLPTSAQLSAWPEVPVTFLTMLVFVGIGEEGGWTAFAAPLLLQRHGLLGAWAIMSSLRIAWHLPLMIGGQLPWSIGILGNAGFQLIVLVIMQATNGRWSLAAVWHASLNAFGGAFFFTMVSGADQTRLGNLLGGAYALLAIAVFIIARRSGNPHDQVQQVVQQPGFPQRHRNMCEFPVLEPGQDDARYTDRGQHSAEAVRSGTARGERPGQPPFLGEQSAARTSHASTRSDRH